MLLNTDVISEIFFLGPSGSYCEVALKKFCKKFKLSELEKKPKHSILAILKALENCKTQNILAVIPVENSIEGVVRETLDNLTKLDNETLKILAENVVDVNHCLVSKSKDKSEIKHIISHTQALAQCREFLQNNFQDNILITETDSTAQAVKKLLDLDNSYAAIASEHAAELYKIPVIFSNINDEKDNKTRFILLGNFVTKSTGNDKTSISFSTPNKPGALSVILNILDEYQINMSYIDSRPSRKVLGEYTFYIDFDGHIDDDKIKAAVGKIKNYTTFFKHLGSYPKVLL